MIYREINNIQVAVNERAGNEIFFTKDFLDKIGNSAQQLTPSEICQIIAGDSFVPLILSWEIIDKCNLKCPFCYIVGHSNYKSIRFEDIKVHLQLLIDMGLMYCQLTGGEALVHKDFNKIYKFLKHNGVLVEIYSNGYLISDDLIELFEELPPYRLEISVYGVSQYDFDQSTGTTGKKYERVLDNIIKMKEKGIDIRCKTPINSLTNRAFESIRLWCQDNSIDFYYSTNIYRAHDGQELQEFQVSLEEIAKYEAKKILEIDHKYPGTVDVFKSRGIHNCYTCGVRNYGFHINANFELLPCSETHIDECKYNILELGLAEALSRNRKFVGKHLDSPIQGCVGCEASGSCKMCPAIAVAETDSKGVVEYFKLPDGHCDFERKKYHDVLAAMLI